MTDMSQSSLDKLPNQYSEWNIGTYPKILTFYLTIRLLLDIWIISTCIIHSREKIKLLRSYELKGPNHLLD